MMTLRPRVVGEVEIMMLMMIKRPLASLLRTDMITASMYFHVEMASC